MYLELGIKSSLQTSLYRYYPSPIVSWQQQRNDVHCCRSGREESCYGNIDFVLGSLRTSTNLSKVFQQFIKHRYCPLMRMLRELVQFWHGRAIGCCSEGRSLIRRRNALLSLHLQVHTGFRVQKTLLFYQRVDFLWRKCDRSVNLTNISASYRVLEGNGLYLRSVETLTLVL